jgi:hypothetical protein
LSKPTATIRRACAGAHRDGLDRSSVGLLDAQCTVPEISKVALDA